MRPRLTRAGEALSQLASVVKFVRMPGSDSGHARHTGHQALVSPEQPHSQCATAENYDKRC